MKSNEQPIKRKEEKNKKSGCRHNWFYSPNTFSKYCPSCHRLKLYNPPKQKAMNKSIKSKEEILAKHCGHHADLLADDLLNSECIKPKEAFAAMQDYGEQIAAEIKKWNENYPVQSGEERLFTLKEAKDIWDSGLLRGSALDASDLEKYPNQQQYFKEKFNISI